MPKSRSRVDPEFWHSQSQPRELAWHEGNAHHRGNPSWLGKNASFWRSHGFEPGDFAGKRVLDVGAGSRMRGVFFESAQLVCIEPLAGAYRNLPWCDLDKSELYDVAAEKRIPGLVVDFAFCVNVLDHCHDARKVLSNIAAYSSRLFLAVDCRSRPTAMHPLYFAPADVTALVEEAGFAIEDVSETPGFGSDGRAVAVHARAEDVA